MKWPALALAAAALWLAAGCEKPETEADERPAPAAERVVTEAADRAPAEPGERVVTLGEEAIAASHLHVVELRAGSGVVTARFPASIDFNQNATSVVQPPLEGRLEQWLVNVGDRVKKGDVLGRVESPQNLGAPIPLKALLAGEILERNAALGDWVKPGDKLVVISELDVMWVVARVREDMVNRILTHEPAAIRVLSSPSDVFAGKLLRVSASVDPETRTVDFVFAVPNPGRTLRAGMFAEASLAIDRVEDRLLVPEEAIQSVAGRSIVFIEEERGRYRVAPLRLGRKLDESYEVLEGAGNGARVVTAGSFVLKSEALRADFAGDQD